MNHRSSRFEKKAFLFWTNQPYKAVKKSQVLSFLAQLTLGRVRSHAGPMEAGGGRLAGCSPPPPNNLLKFFATFF